MAELSPDNVRYLSTRGQALAGIQERILRERLRAGDRLPPVDVLARTLGVGRTTVREALRLLESLGILDKASTGDATVTGRPTPAVDNLFRLHVALSGFHTADLMSVRIELERSAAARAAADASDKSIAGLSELVEAMERPDLSQAQFRELDCDFHLGVAVAGSNGLTTDLLNALRDAVKGEMSSAYSRVSDWPATARLLAYEHRCILSSIRTGSSEQAADAVSAHITGFYRLQAG
jgi:DNA-binding FadR family transcriptional regulator